MGMLIRLQCIYNFFIVPCYYIIHLGCFICIYMSFYMIFGTNLLTQSPVPVSVFSLFSVLQKRDTKRSPIDVPIFDDFLWTRRNVMGSGCAWRVSRGGHNPPGHAWASRRTLVSCAHLGLPLWYFFGPSCVFWPRKILQKVLLPLDSVWY